MPHTYVIGDIHGAFNALQQCLQRANFQYDTDHLICLGDICDGWPDTRTCVDELLKIKNLTYIIGNHDVWFMAWLKSNTVEDLWIKQGGEATLISYQDGIPSTHKEFFDTAVYYFISNNRLFVHAGFDPGISMLEQTIRTLTWDRTLIQKAWELLIHEVKTKLTPFDEVYLGHTPIPFHRPMESCNIWMMDTGAGWSGVLSMMDVNTKQVFTSDAVPSLYPGVEGRIKKH